MMVTLILDLTDLNNDKESKSIKFKFRRLILKNKMFVHFMDRSRRCSRLCKGVPLLANHSPLWPA